MTTEWRSKANCLGTDPELFFPTDSRAENRLEVADICGNCTVSAECRGFADQSQPTRAHGIWGGLSVEERKRLRETKGTA
ncbi:WhiB family transcriptional regulator [Cryobacterium melibiosiphilum]|uniref:WhiB family transcriptional regulator n=1 Tax=Cryobacterium melibiosiphilum TaxID=995039 RepID=A0A3A5MF77_9MICO|nr:WhiB family transcriptional regulator [Cryobacterium melibiosiphilum]